MKITPIAAILCVAASAGQAHPIFRFDEKSKKEHKVVVTEVLQTTSYTYLHVKENDSLQWLAVPKMEAKVGETYYYIGAMSMKEFESKELKRKFDEVLFLGGVSSQPITSNAGATNAHQGGSSYTRRANPEPKKEVKIETPADCISIGKLFAEKESLAGKTVKVKGQVTKYSPQIMDKNWIHLQDGTENNGQYDLVITTTKEVKTGDIVTLEGKITLNKDFGYGYHFEVMMEEATIK